VLEPVAVGKLEVQQVGEYRGADLKGLILGSATPGARRCLSMRTCSQAAAASPS
jgi:hypothetical protein